MDEAYTPWSLTGCTLCGNGAGIVTMTLEGLTLAHTIIALSTEGPAIDFPVALSITCCDFYGNAGGDWTYMEEFLGVDGNICEDPVFCDPEAGNLTLHDSSPCAAENNPECGQIGAWPVGCGPSGVPDDSEPTVRAPSWGALKSLFR